MYNIHTPKKKVHVPYEKQQYIKEKWDKNAKWDSEVDNSKEQANYFQT